LTPSYSEKADWISFVFSSLGKPVRKRMRVTEAERPEREVDIDGGSALVNEAVARADTKRKQSF